jgi:hypothetical protein
MQLDWLWACDLIFVMRLWNNAKSFGGAQAISLTAQNINRLGERNC